MTFKSIGLTVPTEPLQNRSEGGTKRGETGVAISPQNSSEIATWLSAQDPREMDKAAVSRMSSLGVTSEIKYRGVYPEGKNGEKMDSYRIATGCVIQGNDDQRKAALAEVVKFQTPATLIEIESWIGELSVLTAGRGERGISAEVQMSAYSSRLSRYPADVVRHALIGKTWKWFPSWEELERVCDAAAAPRKAMVAALSQPEPTPEPIRRPPTEDEKARMSAMIAEAFPDRSNREVDAAVSHAMSGDCMTVTTD